jgi:hypothetical protein
MMAHHFMLAPDHFTVEAALRFGQVRGLGGSEVLAGAVAATRLGRSFEHDEFWRSVLQFFVNEPTIDPIHIGPILVTYTGKGWRCSIALQAMCVPVPDGYHQSGRCGSRTKCGGAG